MKKLKTLFNWSGGKDSALALHHSLQNPKVEIAQLLTSVNSEQERVSMHGVRKALLEKQAFEIGLPLYVFSLPGEISMEQYDALMKKEMQRVLDTGITHSAFGDIFLEDLKKYREERLAEVNLTGLFPLWKRNTNELIEEFLDLGFRTIVVSVDGSKLDKSFVGRELTREFVADLPNEVDPCGENGEFHTFVFDGPIFKKPIAFDRGEVVGKEYKLDRSKEEVVIYWFQDLIPKNS